MNEWKQRLTDLETRVADLEDWLGAPGGSPWNATRDRIEARYKSRQEQAQRPECEFRPGNRVWWNISEGMKSGVIDHLTWNAETKTWMLSIDGETRDYYLAAILCHQDRRKG